MEKEMALYSSILAWRIPMDRGAWCATAHGVAWSQTRLKRLCTHVCTDHHGVGSFQVWDFGENPEISWTWKASVRSSCFSPRTRRRLQACDQISLALALLLGLFLMMRVALFSEGWAEGFVLGPLSLSVCFWVFVSECLSLSACCPVQLQWSYFAVVAATSFFSGEIHQHGRERQSCWVSDEGEGGGMAWPCPLWGELLGTDLQTAVCKDGGCFR